MRATDIILGEYYRIKNNSVGYAKPLKILKPKQAENKHNYIIVKCEWTDSKNANFGFIKYFKPVNLVRIK